jgi:glycosidase
MLRSLWNNRFKTLSALLMAGLSSISMLSCSSSSVETPAASQTASPVGDGTAPEWSKDDVIYEVNVRQYSPEGTFAAVTEDLERLDELGVDILWLMPIHPVGVEKRKGGLGSYYAVQDYKGINPEFGGEADLRALIEGAHERGMHVILDWVANHSSWDNAWISEHPDWYTKDSLGQMQAPVADWSDVADLNYDHPGLRNAMVDALEYWVREFDLDGYRCDVAGMVPYDFWDSVRTELDQIKPVFMLAEWDDPAIHTAFDMTYTWDLHHRMNEIAKGNMPADSIRAYYEGAGSQFSDEDYRMLFTSNHDENSWNGTVFERMGDAHQAMAVAAFTLPGMPLIYSGQEAPMRERLAFFDKDTIQWDGYAYGAFYAELCALKEEQSALWNGIHGGPVRWLHAGDEEHASILVFARGENDEVLVALNFGAEAAEVTLAQPAGRVYEERFSGQKSSGEALASLRLEPYAYQVWVQP